jgi:hypothetical protein
MIRDAINKILELSVPAMQEIDGRTYSDRNIFEVVPPRPDLLMFNGLSGIASALSELETFDNVFLHVEDELNVSIKLSNPDVHGRVIETARATAKQHVADFKFDRYYDTEDFIIEMQACFVQNDVTDRIIKMASGVTGTSEVNLSDDGVSQSVTTGKTIKSTVKIENPLFLQPYRTFVEVPQPESPYILRVRTEGTRMALYQAGAGLWKKQAMDNIAAYFAEKFPELKILA